MDIWTTIFTFSLIIFTNEKTLRNTAINGTRAKLGIRE